MKKLKHMRIDPDIHAAIATRRGRVADIVGNLIHDIATGKRLVKFEPARAASRTRTGVNIEEADIVAVAALAEAHNMSFDVFITEALREYLNENTT
jgi:predicted DNA binding CopG/RHH family protein